MKLFRNRLNSGYMDSWYYNAIDQVDYFVKRAKTSLEKVRAFNYAMYVIRAEYIAQTKAKIFREKKTDIIRNLFPCGFIDENGARHEFCKEENRRKISLSDNVAVTAWKIDRLANILPIIYKEGFSPDSNHKANYYTEIDLTAVYNGNHSVSSGIFCKSGYIYADVFDITQLFDHVDTDGWIWINRHTKERLTDVSDIHIAVLYEIARRRWNYLKTLDLETADYCRTHAEIFRRDTDYYTIVAGTTGTGKSSFLGALSADRLHCGCLLPCNADRRALELLFERHENIIEESSLVSNTFMWVREAKKHRYFVKMYYIGLDSVDECIRRTKNNLSSNGLSEQSIRFNFEARIECLFAVLPYCDEVDFYDNLNGFRKVAELRNRDLFPTGELIPDWFNKIHQNFLKFHDLIYEKT